MPTSSRPGMGADIYEGGATFRVWAPFATSVSVAGSFNAWSLAADPLTAEGNGYWSRDVANANVNDQYKFVLTSPYQQDPLWKNDPYARSVTNSVGNSIIAETEYTWQAAGYSTPPWNELVIYELHVGSFQFDPNSRSGRGNFQTVIGKLDYLRDLGINAIQLLPADEFPGDISWGYNPSHIFAIEESYGGPNGLRQLVDEAHRRGIAVLFDVVYNHFGPNDLNLWQFDGWNEFGQGGIYFYNNWRNETPWGRTRPDYGRGEVRQFIRDNALRWLEQRHCDGLRFDATGWIRNVFGRNNDPGSDIPEGWSLLRWINSEILGRQPWKITIAEDMQDNEWITKRLDAGGAGFGAQWGAGFMHCLRDTIIAPSDHERNMDALRSFIEQRFNNDAFQRIVYTESHDEVGEAHDPAKRNVGQARIPEQIWPSNADSFYSQKRSTLGAAIVFTAPGIPMIFMGQEFLEWGRWSDARALDWSKVDRFPGIRNLYQDLIRLRRNWLNNTAGLKGPHVNVFHLNRDDKVIAFHRWDRGGPRDDVVIIANFGARSYPSYSIGIPRDGLWRVRFNSDWKGYSPAFAGQSSNDFWAATPGQDNMPFRGAVELGPYTAIILSQE